MLTNILPHATTITMEQAVAKLGAEAVETILAAAMSDPEAMLQFANDISPPAEPVQDYITEVDTRRALFDELRTICQHHQIPLNATIFAVFMVAPVTEVRTFFESIPRESGLADIADDFRHRSILKGTMEMAPEAMRACTFQFPFSISKLRRAVCTIALVYLNHIHAFYCWSEPLGSRFRAYNKPVEAFDVAVKAFGNAWDAFSDDRET